MNNPRGKVGNKLIDGILPDSKSLSVVLSKVLIGNGFAEGKIKVLDRQPNDYTSTFPCEIVTCLLQNGLTLQLFCKYGSEKYYDIRGNLDYESQVYRNILQPLQVSSPIFYGWYKDEKNNSVWLFLEYIDRAFRLNKTEGPAPMIQAANWIGRFHASAEIHLSKAPQEFLFPHNVDYYLDVTQRALRLTGRFNHHFAWLSTLCERSDEMAALLLPNNLTVIHGEYYPRNILYQDRVIRPVDWQTAAFAAGEIDLASLTENWSPEIVLACEHEYQRTRWPEHVAEDFHHTLGAARLYLQLFYLGSHHQWIKSRGNMSLRFEKLKHEGERLGLI